MLEIVDSIIKKHPSRAEFDQVLGIMYPKHGSDYRFVTSAYDTAKELFREDLRQSGERYFEHLRRVFLIETLYLRVRDPEELAAALLHDSLEDKKKKGWNQDRIAAEFSKRTSIIVFGVSKEPLELFGGDEGRQNNNFYDKLRRCNDRAIFRPKLSDVLDNQMTMWAKSEAKQREKVWEAEHIYLPFAEEHNLLIHEIEEAIANTKKRWIKQKKAS